MRLSASAMEDEPTVNPDEEGFLRWPPNRLDPSDRRRPLEAELLRRPLPLRLSDLKYNDSPLFLRNDRGKRQRHGILVPQVISQINVILIKERHIYLWISSTLSVYSSSSMSTNNGRRVPSIATALPFLTAAAAVSSTTSTVVETCKTEGGWDGRCDDAMDVLDLGWIRSFDRTRLFGQVGSGLMPPTFAGDCSIGLSLPSLFLDRPVVLPSVVRMVSSPPSPSSTANVTETLYKGGAFLKTQLQCVYMLRFMTDDTSRLKIPLAQFLQTLPVRRRCRRASIPCASTAR